VPNPVVDVDSRTGSACYPWRTFYPLSDGPSTWNRRITKACFRICSTCRSRSQAPLCLCTPRLVTNQAEGTIARLRYILGGDRPSQTARLTMSQGRLHGAWLDTQLTKGGISRLAPRGLAPPLQSLPPILHMLSRVPMSGYSKGAQGLSVQTRVSGIFTAATVSPSSSRRQCPDRYTIRAGRNLPDKEFRSSWSPCRHGARTISSTRVTEPAGVWPLRIPKRSCEHFGLSC
jgi:hypothetical protein